MMPKKKRKARSRIKAKPKAKPVAKPKTVKVLMKTSYRDIVKAGDVFETDPAKAAELIKLGRAKEISQE